MSDFLKENEEKPEMSWIVLAVFLWGLVHSLLATHKAKELALRIFGENLNRFYRLIYNVFAGVSFLPVLFLIFRVPDRKIYLVPAPWSLFMLGGELLAVAGLFSAFRQTDAWDFVGLRQIEASPQPSKLTISGLYRYIRHPLYSTGLAILWLLPLMTVNILAANIALTVYVFIGATIEERKLRSEFGQEYSEYARVTPMFIPFIKGNKKRGESS
jgi:protein-S-isoprenylcysteine O-methyltransferase Ste14